jgi:hypothetical protein
MAQTIITYTASEGETEFSFAAMEFDKTLSLVVTTINDILHPLEVSEVDYDTQLITLNSGLIAGDSFKIFRSTAVVEPAVLYTDTAVLTDSDLNLMVDQLLFRLQELIEQIAGNFDPDSIALSATVTSNTNRLTVIEADNWINTLRIADGAVTKAKIEPIDHMRVLGNTSGGSASPESIIKIFDEDDMVSNSDTDLASQQSIKNYVDGLTDNRYALIVDEKGTGVAAQTNLGSNVYVKRDLTEIKVDSIGIALNDNTFTLPVGNYRIVATVPAAVNSATTNKHKAKLRNDSDALDVLFGTSAVARLSQSTSNIIGNFEVTTDPKDYEIWHFANLNDSIGGGATSDGSAETYTTVEIWQV